ncbi:MAG: hypothetical protein OIF57_06770 [Marinobacterium sp.]|nr:hypothetical protein [Marinobacterium sp.]
MYPKGNLNRLWLILGAVDALDHPSLEQISRQTQLPYATVDNQLKKLARDEIPGLQISKTRGTYAIDAWGILNPAGIRNFYRHAVANIH